MRLIFIYGPPASGKQTVAQELAARTNYKLIHNHQTFDLLTSVFEVWHPAFTSLLNQLRLNLVQAALDHNLDGLILTHVYGAAEAESVQQLRELVESRGSTIDFVRLLPDRAELDRRVQHPGRRQYNKVHTPGALSAHLNTPGWALDLEIPGVTTYTINNTKLTPVQAADRIITKFALPRPPRAAS